LYTTVRSVVPGHGGPTAGRPDGRPGRQGRGVGRVVLLLGVVSLLTDASSEMVAAVLPLYLTATVGLSPFQYGAVDGLYQGGSALVRIVGGISADLTRRPKWIAGLGYGLSAVCKLALLPATALVSIGAVIGVDRLGKGLRTAPRDAMIAEAAGPERLGRAFGTHRALDTIGAAAGPLIAFALLWAIPGAFHSLFVVSFCLAAVGVAVLVLAVPDRLAAAAGPGTALPGPPATVPAVGQAGWRAARRGAGELIRDRSFRRLCVGAAVLSVATVSDGFIYLRLQQVAELPTSAFPLLYLGTSLVYLTLAVPLGRLADRVGRRRVFLVGHLVAVTGYAALLFGPGGSVLVVLVLVLLGIYYAATDGVLAAAAAAITPEPVRGTGLSIVHTVVALGRMTSALAFGAAWSGLGPNLALAGFAVALTAGCLTFVALQRSVRP
jgi:MFS family permease